MILFDSHLKKQLYKFISNPFVTILISIITAIIFLYLGKDEKKPAYYISEPELISERLNDKITILYDDVKFENLYTANLVLWNEGSQIVDADDFVASNLPTLYSEDSIKFISCTVTDRSRKDLNIASHIKNNEISFQIDNEEALENADGLSFRIIYTVYDKMSTKLKFRSRIKGTKDGFVYKDLKKYKLADNRGSVVFLWMLLFLLLTTRVTVLLISKKTVTFTISEMIFVLVYLSILSYKSYIYIFFSANIKWLKL